MHQLIIEAFLVGLLTILIGSIVGAGFGYINTLLQPEYIQKNNNWNKYHIMEQSLFFTGFFIHLLCEYFGINKLYCKKGYACL